jgi:hypothetical protein
MPLGDVELARPKPINGFPRVAAKITADPDKTTTIYRRFDRLSARNLLFLEAELAELEALQDQYDAEDTNSADFTTISCHSDWRKFERWAGEKDGNGRYVQQRQRDKMDLALRIKDKLKEYRKLVRWRLATVRFADAQEQMKHSPSIKLS